MKKLSITIENKEVIYIDPKLVKTKQNYTNNKIAQLIPPLHLTQKF